MIRWSISVILICTFLAACGAKSPAGGLCAEDLECTSAGCVDALCCDSPCSGACQACSQTKTGKLDGTCASIVAATDPDNECAGALSCNGRGACQSAHGAACTAPTDCGSGFCVDGLCCNSDCTGTCMACSAKKKGGGQDGVCDAISDGTDPDDECAAQAQSTCGRTGDCNGVGGCALWPNGTVCVAASCANGTTLSKVQTCTAGSCSAQLTMNCTPYVCATTACRTACNSDGDCSAGNYCSSTTCVVKLAAGLPCSASNQCINGTCLAGNICN